MMKIKTFPLFCLADGLRVRRVDAGPFDYAYNRVGTVHSELFSGKLRYGVLWDGCPHVFEYPRDEMFEVMLPGREAPATC